MCERCASNASPSRRSFLGVGAGLALAGGLAGPAMAQGVTTTPTPLSGEAALKRLMAGNARYAANKPNERDFSAGRAARARSQHPFASIVSCADSRLAPELAFDQSAGDLFVVRLAGNFVNEDGLASLEFGAAVLQSPLILVLGHTSCGAIASTIDVVKNGTQLPGHLPSLVNAIKPAVLEAQKAGAANVLEAATEANVRLNVERLKNAAPILAQRIADKKLTVVGGIYELATGKVKLI
ncbi:carbonic anhydrase [Bosea sp. 124]|uniref:carbonic anhydrase n=1 Tax=Bosea sp. 124 TaxID=2135642 RepID=UPI000D3743C3|nr:carbonic anhydrase [Bosea sp. 124]PTM40192.1 carbonic anhydrase [Bosea sp. 124]